MRADDGDATPSSRRANPWGDPETRSGQEPPSLRDLAVRPTNGATTPSAAAPTTDLLAGCGIADDTSGGQNDRYAAWAERMKAKRVRSQQIVNGTADDDAPSTAAYWSTEAVFAESARVSDEEQRTRPNPWQTVELLSVLDLREGATLDDVSRAFRQLAKEHHPDRFVGADDATQEFHADKMRSINEAYHTLRARLSV